MIYDTGFLAEEWLDFLKEKVEPECPGITFSSYIPHDASQPWITWQPMVRITIRDKDVFGYRLKGVSMDKKDVECSLVQYVLKNHKQIMRTRVWIPECKSFISLRI